MLQGSGPLAAVVAAFVGAGCTASASSVRYDEKITAGEGPAVVVGKVGFPSRAGDAMIDGSVVAIDGHGKKWRISLETSLSQDGGNSAPFFVRLPAGRYQLEKLELIYSNSSWVMEDMELAMDLEAGRVSCVGAAYIRGRRPVYDDKGSRLMTSFEMQDDCSALRQLMAPRAPFLPPQTTVRLLAPR